MIFRRELEITGYYEKLKELTQTDDIEIYKNLAEFYNNIEREEISHKVAEKKYAENYIEVANENGSKKMNFTSKDPVKKIFEDLQKQLAKDEIENDNHIFVYGIDPFSGLYLDINKNVSDYFLRGKYFALFQKKPILVSFFVPEMKKSVQIQTNFRGTVAQLIHSLLQINLYDTVENNDFGIFLVHEGKYQFLFILIFFIYFYLFLFI